MRSLVRTLVVGGLVLMVGTLALAAEGKKARPTRPEGRRFDPFAWINRLNLSEEQKGKVEALRKEYEPKLAEGQAKLDSILTPEQKKAQEEAIAKAKEAGKTGRELFEAGRNAVQLTEEQQKQMKEVRTHIAELQRQIREKIMGLLTDEQKAELRKRFGGERPKGGQRPERKK